MNAQQRNYLSKRIDGIVKEKLNDLQTSLGVSIQYHNNYNGTSKLVVIMETDSPQYKAMWKGIKSNVQPKLRSAAEIRKAVTNNPHHNQIPRSYVLSNCTELKADADRQWAEFKKAEYEYGRKVEATVHDLESQAQLLKDQVYLGDSTEAIELIENFTKKSV